MSQTTNQANREMAIYYIAEALGIQEADVTDDLKLGPWVRYIASTMYFRTHRAISVLDLGTVTVGDILEQLK